MLGGIASFWSTVSPMNLFQAPKVKPPTSDEALDGDEVIVPNTETQTDDSREPAIATLGQGSLQLSDFGQGSDSGSPPLTTTVNPLAGAKVEEASAAEAVSTAYAADKLGTTGRAMSMVADQISNPERRRSTSSAVGSNKGDSTPPASVTNGDDIKRTGSMRSRISGGRRTRRKRDVSIATASTIGAALGAAHAGFANPSSTPTLPIADSKRNRDFHLLFRSVADDDFLVTDYLCALQREILLQGCMYVSQKSICFYSNIIGWVTNLVISFDEVVALEKKNTVRLFPNAIVVQTLHAKHTFTSFLKRESAYDSLLSVWKTHHPNLKTTETGHVLDNDAKADVPPASSGSDESDETDDDEDDGRDVSVRAPSIAPSEEPAVTAYGQRVVSTPFAAVPAAESNVQHDFPGPSAHAPTECSDQATHYEKHLYDTTIPAPLGKVYSLMFGPQSGAAMRKFFVEDEKFTDVQIEDDKKGMDDEVKQFSYSYIKPLQAPIGPKSTKCIVNQFLDTFDLERSVSVSCSTLTPDVPNGSSFVCKTRYCLMWAPNNSTRFLMNYTIEWSAKSWLKGPIEKGASEGQLQYGKDIVAFLKAQVSGGKVAKVKTKKGKKKRTLTDSSAPAPIQDVEQPATKAISWGPLEPVHAILSAIVDILEPMISVNAILGVLLVFASLLLVRQSYFGPRTVLPAAQRTAAYDEIWKNEEAELWRWLEDRIGMDEIATPRTGQKRTFAARIDNELLSERDMDDAIRVTQERLEALKEVVNRRRRSV